MTAPAGAAGGPRIALLTEALWLNGAVNLTLGLARRWAGNGSVLAVRKRLAADQTVDVGPGVPVRQLMRPGERARWTLPFVLTRMIRIARRSDLVLVSGEIGLAPVVGFLAARAAGKPFVIAVHADLDEAIEEWVQRPLRPVLRFAHRHADGAICVEGALRASLERNGLPADRIRVVDNGIDVEAVRLKAESPSEVPESTGPLVVMTGRLAAQKGTDLMVRAHAAVVGDTPHTVLVLNDGPDLAALRSLVDELGVASTFRFLGRVPPHPMVARADLFCLPSRHEGLPLALLEAMALGTPVLASRSSPGVVTALDDGRAGGLVPVGDVDALAAALRDHLRDPDPLRRKARAATAQLARYDEAAMARGWQEAAAELAGRRGGRRS